MVKNIIKTRKRHRPTDACNIILLIFNKEKSIKYNKHQTLEKKITKKNIS